ncbi:DNA repair protein RadC [Patescibacteria group bacterium]|nr:DNA repair protein RadC [Patescibacteria group bacterium]
MISAYKIKDNDLVLSSLDREYILKVKDLPEEDKPREKLIKFGPSILSTSELIAVLLNVGTKKEEVMSMSSRILKDYGEKNIVNQKNPEILEKELDIPIGKACQLIASFELGRRFFKKQNNGYRTIRSPKQVYEYLKDMRELPKEHLRGIYLNSRNRIIHDEVISIGSLTANIVHPREVFKPALEYSAAAVILAHNHPSNICKATQSDIAITKQIIEAGKILGIDILDHIIITNGKFMSIPVDYDL